MLDVAMPAEPGEDAMTVPDAAAPQDSLLAEKPARNHHHALPASSTADAAAAVNHHHALPASSTADAAAAVNHHHALPASAEKPASDHRHSRPASTAVPLVNEVQLTAATGGAELSCYRCTVPFGVVVLIAGVVVTAVAYGFNSHGSTISYLGLLLLGAGLLLLAASAVCWRLRLERKRERRRESQTALVTHRRSLFT